MKFTVTGIQIIVFWKVSGRSFLKTEPWFLSKTKLDSVTSLKTIFFSRPKDLSPRKFFVLKAELNTGPWCGWKNW